MSDLPPPPSPPGGWPQQPQQPQPGPGQWPSSPGSAPAGAQPPPGTGGPWGAPQAYAPSAGGYGPQRAGFWQRFAAALLDGLIVGLFAIPAVIAFAAGPREEEPCRVDRRGEVDVFDEGPNNAICEVPTAGTWAIGGMLYAAAFIGGVVYFAQMEGKRGRTLGKQALSIRTVDIRTGQPIGVGRGVGRYFARWLSAIPCYLGYLWMLWDDQKQTWHDKMTSSVVIRDTYY